MGDRMRKVERTRKRRYASWMLPTVMIATAGTALFLLVARLPLAMVGATFDFEVDVAAITYDTSTTLASSTKLHQIRHLLQFGGRHRTVALSPHYSSERDASHPRRRMHDRSASRRRRNDPHGLAAQSREKFGTPQTPSSMNDPMRLFSGKSNRGRGDGTTVGASFSSSTPSFSAAAAAAGEAAPKRVNSDVQSRFRTVFTEGLWLDSKGGHLGESRSGQGSNPGGVPVKQDSLFLKRVMKHYLAGVKNPRIVDVPCGDMAWMPAVLNDVAKEFPGGITYTGLDIVPEAINGNRDKLGESVDGVDDGGGRVKYLFQVFDITTTVPPNADLLICRDLVNHLSTADVKRLLKNLRASGTKYLVISNNENPDRNGPGEWGPFAGAFRDVGGSSRHVDIRKRPFYFGSPITSNDHLSVWENTPKGWRRRR